jgi:hypothetical protein
MAQVIAGAAATVVGVIIGGILSYQIARWQREDDRKQRHKESIAALAADLFAMTSEARKIVKLLPRQASEPTNRDQQIRVKVQAFRESWKDVERNLGQLAHIADRADLWQVLGALDEMNWALDASSQDRSDAEKYETALGAVYQMEDVVEAVYQAG